MKKVILVIFGLWASSQLLAQSLENTYWQVSPEGSSFSIITYFGKDSIFVADSLDDEFAYSQKYRILDDTFFVQNRFHPFCDSSIVGKYFYTLQDSIMRFELIEDNCRDREFHLPLLVHRQLDYSPPINITEEGIVVEETDIPVTFYPNPNPNGVFFYENKTNDLLLYRLYDRWGNLKWNGLIRAYGEIHLPNESGVYFLTIIGEAGQVTFKLVRS